MSNKKAVMGLSGGMDSSTLLGHLLREGYEVHCCIFTYGSKHNKYENMAALDVAGFYQDRNHKVEIHTFDLYPLMLEFKSALLLSGDAIPEGHYNDDNMKKTVVPGRNLIFISLMAGLAESIDAQVVALGVHAGDHHIYPDCRIDFVKAADSAIYLSSDKRVELIAPFQRYTKKDILLTGFTITPRVPYELTRTCYKDQPVSCGKCGSCQERLEAFQLFGREDLIEYES